MKAIMNGKVYDTKTAHEIGSNSYSNPRDFNYFCETLYRKRTGEFFLHGKGGPMSKYSRRVEQNTWSGDEVIEPLTYEKARSWAEKNINADTYLELFDKHDKGYLELMLQLPNKLVRELEEEAKSVGLTLDELIENKLRLAVGKV